MPKAKVLLESVSPYSQSRPHNTPMEENESHDDFERRTWREKAHCTPAGQVYIPPMAFKNCIRDAAMHLAEKMEGKGNKQWGKHFQAGVFVIEPLLLPLQKSELNEEWLYANADGKKNSGTRVWRCFPVIHQWEGEVVFEILDPYITKDKFHEYIVQAGNLIGIGRFRAYNGGFYGRFKVAKFEWVKD